MFLCVPSRYKHYDTLCQESNAYENGGRDERHNYEDELAAGHIRLDRRLAALHRTKVELCACELVDEG